MEKSPNQVTVEEIQNCRFYKKVNGKIVHMYDFWDPDLLNAGEGVTLIPEDRSQPFALPEYWYFSINCPSYIDVTAPDTYNVKSGVTDTSRSVNVTASVSSDDLILNMEFRHSGYTEYTGMEGLHSQNDLSTYVNIVPAGVDTSVNGYVRLVISDLNIDEDVVASSGIATKTISRSLITNGFFQGTLQNGNDIMSFQISNIPLSNSVQNQNKMDDLREERNNRLAAEDWKVVRHITQQVSEVETSLTTEQFKALCDYMQALRDLPANVQDLDNVEWPEL